MVTPRFFGPTNAFLLQATGQLIGFVRKPGQFKLFDYVQTVPTKTTDGAGRPIGVYAVLDPDAPVRTGGTSGPTVTQPSIQGDYSPAVDAQWRWDPGQDAPPGNIRSNFYWQPFECIRRAYPYDFDEQTDDSADLPVAQIYRQQAASLAMTVKTHRVITMLQTSANWPSSNTADANVLNGGVGKWSTASSDQSDVAHYLAIRKTLQKAAITINLLTNATVQPEDLRCLISPNLAQVMGSTSEIYDYVKYGPFARERQEGKNQLNEMYGVPRYYAGIELVVEDCPFVTDNMTAAGTASTTGRQYVKNDSTAIMVSRKGGVNGVYGAASFSTVQLYYYKYEMAVEEFHDSWHKKHRGRVVDQYAEVLAAARAGYLITNCV